MLTLKSATFHPAGESEDDDYDEDCFEVENLNNKEIAHNNQMDYEEKFHKAIAAGNLKAVEDAWSNGKLLINKTYSGGFNGLMTACHLGHAPIVAFLLEAGANPNFRNENQFTSLMAVCFSFCNNNDNLKSCANLLFEKDANLNAADCSGTTPLMYACKFGHTGLIQELIKRGANVNMNDRQGWTALFWAVMKGKVESVQMLIAAGAKKKMKDRRGKTAYSLALSKRGAEKILAVLNPKKYGAKAASVDSEIGPNSMGAELASLKSKLDRFVPSNTTRKQKGDKLNLFEFLTVTDGELNALGVQYSWQRRQTLAFIKSFHLQPWSVKPTIRMKRGGVRKSFSILEETPILTFTRAANQVLSLHNRLVIIQASAVYLQRQWENEQKIAETGDLKHMGWICITGMNDFVKELQKILKSLDKMDKVVVYPSDYIKKKTLNDGKFKRLISMTMITSLFAFALWKYIN